MLCLTFGVLITRGGGRVRRRQVPRQYKSKRLKVSCLVSFAKIRDGQHHGVVAWAVWHQAAGQRLAVECETFG